MSIECREVGPVDISLIPIGDNYIYFICWGDFAAVVDPAVDDAVLEELNRTDVTLTMILATHKHADHVAGIPGIKQATGAQVVGPRGARIPMVDREVADGDTLDIGPLQLRVMATPGHTTTCISYVSSDPAVVWCGDTLFAGGCGRLFECGPETMWDSLSRLAQLPDHTLVYCGHEYTQSNLAFAASLEPSNAAVKERLAAVTRLRQDGCATIPSTIGEEKRTNPFLRAADPVLRQAVGMPDAAPAEVFAAIRARKDSF